MKSWSTTYLGRTILSIWAWIALVISILVTVPAVFVTWLFTRWHDPARYKAGYRFRRLAVILHKLNPLWKFKVSGKIPDNPRNPYVVISNHESFVDMILISQLPFEMKWISKSTFFKIPLVGWTMRMAGDIRLDRNDKKSGARVVRESLDRLSKKVSIMIFPEGTRSADGVLKPFKSGAFRIAIRAGVPILPLAVVGTREALVKNDWRYGTTDAEVRVLDPIPTEGLTKADVNDLRDRAHRAISDALADMKAERAA
ncbi:MAG: 1-acyl-sn-glycerol-3-phosphate acyltransferase [Ilumatobacter coccineus]|uniref:1-acyl-sn-glycerol-3-phosphate acyltransferase n=1 Tax=Ilumatobacter coccineus TaxID=467094 RepID=A0A2G6KB28_9ACTN|nr:MAG: 1-acyl-sn-glycerol-3-phosphate acyltransferase [Ilumatobacter coccineus]